MSKTIPVALAAHYATPWHTICTCVKVVRTDGVTLGFNSTNRPLTVAGLVYEPGFDLQALASTESLSVDNLELRIVPDDATVPASDLLTGRWNNAAFTVFEVNYKAPADGINILKVGTLGEVQTRRAYFVVEFRSQSQALQQTQVIYTNKTCRARLGDALCTVDLGPFTYTGTITAADSASIFSDSGRAEADDWFGEGIIQFTSGNNDGFRQKVRAFAAGGEFTLSRPLPFTPAPGDTYSVIAGCRKRHDRNLANPDGVSDCLDKFNNVLNFQGEPHLPGLDALTKPGGTPTQPASTPALSGDSGDGEGGSSPGGDGGGDGS